MNNYKDVSLIIPVYNEKENIELLFNEILKHIGREVEIVVCYDFEDDNTIPQLKNQIDRFKNLKLVKNFYGKGLANALKSGIKTASKSTVITVLADLQDDISYIPKMIDMHEQGFQVVVASRHSKDSKYVKGSLIKKWLSRIAGRSLHCFIKLPTYDATNCFRLYERDFLNSIKIESNGGSEIALELILKAHFKKLKIGELPVIFQERRFGESKFKLVKWLPKYLYWYWYGLTNSFKASN